MHPNKQPRSMDGFIPAGNAPRRVGFDMVKQPAKAANAFPAVGQTLSAYRPSANASASQLRAQPSVANSPFNLDFEEPAGITGQKPKRRLIKKLTWKKVLIIVAVLVLALGGWLGFKFFYNVSKTFNGGVLGILSSTKLKGEDEGRVNILLAGNSSDDAGHNGANLTDSIMVVSINTRDNSAYMISVPRDLWVDIPEYGHAKINEAYVNGETEDFSQPGYFGGGMGLLQQVIQENFNIKLQYYALVNYAALRDLTNAVGGIDFTVKSDNKNGIYDPSSDWTSRNRAPLVKLSNGVHHLDGQQVLNLSRARGDAYGSYGFPAADFDRTNNQRQILLALKARASSPSVIANPAKLSGILDSIGNNVKTNFSTGEVRRLYEIGKKTSNVSSVGLNDFNGKNLLTSYAAPTGQSTLIPAAGVDDFSDIQLALKQLTSNDPVVREGATIVVLNATETSGLAAKAAKSLTERSLSVAATDDARANQATTTIIDVTNGKKPATKKFLMGKYGNGVTTTNPYAGVYDADFILVLGENQVPAAKPATSTETSR